MSAWLSCYICRELRAKGVRVSTLRVIHENEDTAHADLDRESSASVQHFIDTGVYLRKGESDEPT